MCLYFVSYIHVVLKMASKNLNTLNLKTKIDLIKTEQEQKLSVKQLADKYKCGKTQVYKILKNKDDIREKWYRGQCSAKSKRSLKKTGNEEINELVYQWFLNARAKNLPISGPILQFQAKQIAERLGKNAFKASNGWLQSFRNRHEISFK